MAEGIYLLCAATSLLCAALLFRGWLRSRQKLLFWSALCFAGLTVHNALVVFDLVLMPDVDFIALRQVAGVVSISVLLYGLVWEAP